MIVTYHTTQIVRFDTTRIILNSGGWRTKTTSKRMNQVAKQFGLDYRVYSKQNEWFVEHKGIILPFIDGMKLVRG